jgi:hypothetical protein
MKTLNILFLILISNLGSAQIKVLNNPTTEVRGLIGSIESPSVKLNYKTENGTDTLYILTFRNQKYQSIVDYCGIAFNSNKTKLNDLYDLFMSVFKSENINNKTYRVIFELEGKKIAISNMDRNVWLYTEEGYITLSKNDINTIFNKN